MPYSSGGRPATALSATFAISWPSYRHALVPSSRVTNRGARPAYFAGNRPSNTWGGSTTWSSTLTRTMSSICTATPVTRTPNEPLCHYDRSRMGHFQGQRDFGNAGADAVALPALIDTFGVSEPSTPDDDTLF